MFKLTTLAAVVHKARVVERNKMECKKQTLAKSQYLGKRSAFSYPSAQSYEQDSGYKGKKEKYGKKSYVAPSSKEASKKSDDGEDEPKVECKTCFSLHDSLVCKWIPGACFSCGKLGHKSTECKNPILMPIFCF